MTTKVLNIFGGPGAGKSTTAAGVFHDLKIRGYEVELVTEFAKDVVWDEHYTIMADQIYVFAQQQRRVQRCLGKVDYIVTDSPTLLILIYAELYDAWTPELDALVTRTFKEQCADCLNVVLNRDIPYNPHGRMQDEEEAWIIDQKIRNLLEEKDIPYVTFDPSNQDYSKTITSLLTEA